ncbi:MAG: hypothetical protein R2851_02290 [Caldilineaceae bacterium]
MNFPMRLLRRRIQRAWLGGVLAVMVAAAGVPHAVLAQSGSGTAPMAQRPIFGARIRPRRTSSSN